MAKYTSADVQTIEGLAYVRHRAGVYGFDDQKQQGQFQLVKEVIDNTVDEATTTPNKDHVTDIIFIKYGKNYQVIIHDTGRGIPLESLVPCFTVLGTSGKWNKAYSASVGTNGIGAKATAALSRRFCAITRRKEGSAIVSVDRGEIIHQQINKKKITDGELYGTTVFYEPDSDILVGTDKFFDEDGGYRQIVDLIEFIVVFTKNLTVRVWNSTNRVKDPDIIGKPLDVLSNLHNVKKTLSFEASCSCTPTEYMRKRYGLTAKIEWHSETFEKVLDPNDSNDEFGYEISFFLTSDFNKRSGQLISAVNMTQIYNKSAVHLVGFREAIKEQMTDFIDDSEIRNFFIEQYNLPFHSIVMAKYQGAAFKDQDKTNFTNARFLKLYKAHLVKTFENLGKKYWLDLYEMIAEDIEVKYHKFNDRGLNLSASMKNLAYSLNKPGSYCACREKDPSKIELFMVEGDSAMTTIKQICDRDTQAIWMSGGKPVNPFKKDYSVIRKNLAYQDLIKIIGVSPGDTDLSNMNFSTISILADADPDGYHISALMLGILYSINPLILAEKRVRLSTPPLYILTHRVQHKSLFVRDKAALMDARSETARRVINIKLKCGDTERLLDEEEFRSMYYLIHRVGTTIESVAKRLAIHPGILEMFMHCLPHLKGRIDTKAIAKKLNLDYCGYKEANNSLIMTSGADEFVVPLNNVVSDITGLIMPELGPLAFDKIELLISTKLTDLYKNQSVTLMELYHTFMQVSELFNTSRMKGLGQMPKHVLKQTCLDPATRSFVTLTSLGDVDDLYRVLGVDTQARKDLVSQFVGGEDDDYLL